jgi:hypothetical protein
VILKMLQQANHSRNRDVKLSYVSPLPPSYNFSSSAPGSLSSSAYSGHKHTDPQGVTLSTSMISGIAATATASIPASMTSVSITGTPSSWTEAPVLYTQTLVNIQAIVRAVLPHLKFIISSHYRPSSVLV